MEKMDIFNRLKQIMTKFENKGIYLDKPIADKVNSQIGFMVFDDHSAKGYNRIGSIVINTNGTVDKAIGEELAGKHNISVDDAVSYFEHAKQLNEVRNGVKKILSEVAKKAFKN